MRSLPRSARPWGIRELQVSTDELARPPHRPGRLPPQLKRLEAESIGILREVAAEFRRPVMLYSIGKDSERDAAPRAQGVLSGKAAVSAAACRHHAGSSAR